MDQISEVQRQCLQVAFDLFDEDKDGKISIKEVQSVLKKLDHNVAEEQLKDWLEENSGDESCDIDMDHFINLMSVRKLLRQTSDNEIDIEEAFSMLDVNKDGFISVDEVRQVMLQTLDTGMEKEVVEDKIRQADSNGDGMINHVEFVKHFL
eukprot:GFUD01023393.1.p1 GENE.GFUD01023393.1~~GFUD01023393.1.p1  ORF type:complete len:151 (+),score=62.40 GFUD01023393.1:147-599(+)